MSYLGHMSGYGPLYWPCSCPIAWVGLAKTKSRNTEAVATVITVVSDFVVVTAAGERILQTAAGALEDQVVTCCAAVAAAAVVVVVARLPRSSRVTWRSLVPDGRRTTPDAYHRPTRPPLRVRARARAQTCLR